MKQGKQLGPIALILCAFGTSQLIGCSRGQEAEKSTSGDHPWDLVEWEEPSGNTDTQIQQYQGLPQIAHTSSCLHTPGSYVLNVSIASHQDSQAARASRYTASLATADLSFSEIITIENRRLAGETDLDVTNFSVDDVAFLVGHTEKIGDFLWVDQESKRRVIDLPAYAVVVYDGERNDFGPGVRDSAMETVYRFQGKSLTKKPGESLAVSDFRELGVTTLPHNGVSFSILKQKGFANSESVTFRIAHVAHGYGALSITLNLPSCY